MSYFANVGFNPPFTDAFQRLRVSGTGNRWDCELFNDKQPTLMDEILVGAATCTYLPDSRDVKLAVVDAGITNSSTFTGHYDVPYTPGNSQLADVTGTLDSSGLGTGTAELFLRTTVTGTTEEQIVTQPNWEHPNLDIDWGTSQILVMDFQSLRVGLIRYALNRSGGGAPLSSIANDNLRVSGYWQTPTLPVYYRIYNTATETISEMGYGDTLNAIGLRYRMPLNAAATMRCICSTVKSEGGVGLFDLPGFPRVADRYLTPLTVAATLIPVLSIRVKDVINSIPNRGLYIPESYFIQSDQPVYYQLIYRPTLTSPTWNDVDATNSGMQFDVASTGVSGGIVVYADYFTAGTGGPQSRPSDAGGILGRTIMALGRTGTADILTLAAVRTTGTSASVLAGFRWREVR